MYVGPAVSGVLHLGFLALALAPARPEPIISPDSGPPVSVELMSLNQYNAAISRAPDLSAQALISPENPTPRVPNADIALNTPRPVPAPPLRPELPDSVTLTAPPEIFLPELDVVTPPPDTRSLDVDTNAPDLSLEPGSLQDVPVTKNDIIPKDRVRVLTAPDAPEQPRGVLDAPDIDTSPDQPPEPEKLEEPASAPPSPAELAEVSEPEHSNTPPSDSPVPRGKPRGSLAAESTDEKTPPSPVAEAGDGPQQQSAEKEQERTAEAARDALEDLTRTQAVLEEAAEKAKRLAAELAEEQRILEEDARIAAEDERLEAEAKLAEAQAETEAAREQAELEQKKLAEAEEKRAAEEELERQRLAEAEELRKAEEEARKLAILEEQNRLREQAERERLAQEQLRREQEAEQQRLAAEAEEARKYALRQQQLRQYNAQSGIEQQTNQNLGIGAATPAPAPAGDDFLALLGSAVGSAQNSGSTAGSRTFSRNVAAQNNAAPLTQGEQQQVLNQLSRCWRMIGQSTQIVTMRVTLTRDGRVSNAIPLSGSGLAVEHALRALQDTACQPFQLPPQKYGSWQQIDIVFDPRRISLQ